MNGKVALLFLFSIICFFSLPAQVYHYATGKVIPSNEPGLFNLKPGVFESFPAQYGVLLARENREKKNSKLISLPVIRIKAFNKDSVSYPIFLLYGGPGESNIKSELIIDSLLNYHDIVLVGYRGVDGSTELNSETLQNFFEDINTDDPAQLINQKLEKSISEFQSDNIDISGYTINEVCQDLFETQKALGYDSVSFLAFSFGTIIAQQFTQLHPELVVNMVLIGPRPLTNMLIDGSLLDHQLQQIMGRTAINTYDDITSIYNSILQNKVYPAFQFNLFFFSQFYASAKLDALEMAMYSYQQGKVWYLDKIYREFYRNYPGKMVVGDMILKKQHCIDFFSAKYSKVDSSLGCRLAKSTNEWYFPDQPLLTNVSIQKVSPLLIKTLFICGEYDVASPSQLIGPLQNLYPNNQYILINQACHLDFFFDDKPQVISEITHFYKSN